jgi:hypothetical protein
MSPIQCNALWCYRAVLASSAGTGYDKGGIPNRVPPLPRLGPHNLVINTNSTSNTRMAISLVMPVSFQWASRRSGGTTA